MPFLDIWKKLNLEKTTNLREIREKPTEKFKKMKQKKQARIPKRQNLVGAEVSDKPGEVGVKYMRK